MGLHIRVLLLLLPDLHSGFLRRLLGSVYLLSFCRHSKQNGQLAVEPFSGHSMAKVIPVTWCKRSQLFPPPMLKTLKNIPDIPDADPQAVEILEIWDGVGACCLLHRQNLKQF